MTLMPGQVQQQDDNEFSFATGAGMQDGPFIVDPSPLPEHQPRNLYDYHRDRTVDYIFKLDELVGTDIPQPGGASDFNEWLGGEPLDSGHEAIPGLSQEELNELRLERDQDLDEYSFKLESLASRLASDEIETQLGNDLGLKRAWNILKGSFGQATSDLFGTNAGIVEDVQDLVTLESDLKRANDMFGEAGTVAYAVARRSNEYAEKYTRSGIDLSSSHMGVKRSDAGRYLALMEQLESDPDNQELRREANTLATNMEGQVYDYKAGKVQEIAEGMARSAEESAERVGPDLNFIKQAQEGDFSSAIQMSQDQPLNLTIQAIAQSGGASAYTLGAALLGGMLGSIGGPGGAAAGRFQGGYTATFNMTYNSMFVDELMSMGLDLSDLEGVQNALTQEVIDKVDAKIRPAAEFSAAVAGGQMAVGGMVIGIGGKAVPAGTARLPAWLSAQNVVGQTAIQAGSSGAEAWLTPILQGEDEFGTAGSIIQAMSAEAGMAATEPATTGILRASGGLAQSVRAMRERANTPKREATAVDSVIESLGNNETIKEVADRTVMSILGQANSLDQIENQLVPIVTAMEEGGGIESLNAVESLMGNGALMPEGTINADTEADVWQVYPDPNMDNILQLEESRRDTEAMILESDSQADIDAGQELLAEVNADLAEAQADRGDAEVIGLPTRAKMQYIIKGQETIQAPPGSLALDIDPAIGRFDRIEAGRDVGAAEVQRVLDVVNDPDTSVEQKLGAVVEGYLKGAVASTAVRRTDTQSQWFDAMERGDYDAAIRLSGMLDRQNSAFESIKAKTRAVHRGSTASLDGLLGVYRGDGDVNQGIIGTLATALGYNPKSDSPSGDPGIIGRSRNQLFKIISRFTKHDGAQGAGASFVARQRQHARTELAGVMEQMRELMGRHKGLFPSTLSREQLVAIQNYMHRPTADNAKAVDALDPSMQQGATGDRISWVDALDQRRAMRKRLSRRIQKLLPQDSHIVEVINDNMDGYWYSFYNIKNPEKALARATTEQRQMVKDALVERFQPETLFNPSEDSLSKLSKKRLRQLAHLRGIIPKDKSKKALVKLLAKKPPVSPAAMETMVNLVILNADRWTESNFTFDGFPKDEKIAKGTRSIIQSKGDLRKDAALKKAALKDPLAAAISSIYGRVRHPDAVFQTTVIKMAEMIESYQSTQAMLEVAFQAGMASTDPVGSGFTHRLAVAGEHGSMVYEVPGLDTPVKPEDIYVSKEMGEMFDAIFNPRWREGQSTTIQGIVAFNDFLKYMYTVGNLPAHMRNVGSLVMILQRNGTLYSMNLSNIRQAAGVLLNDFTSQDDTGTGGQWNELKSLAIEYDILHNSPKGGTLDDLRSDYLGFLQNLSSDGVEAATALNTLFLSINKRLEKIVGKKASDVLSGKSIQLAEALGDTVSGVFTTLEDSYRYTDEFPKLITFLANRDYYAKLFDTGEGKNANAIPFMRTLIKNGIGTTVTEEHLRSVGVTPTPENVRVVQAQLDQINNMAAAETTQTTPTYSMVAPYMKALRSNPLVGPFPAFTSEVYRNQFNAMQLARSAFTEAIKGEVTLTGPNGTFKMKANRAMLSKRFMAKFAGITLDIGKMHAFKVLGAAAILAHNGGDDESDDFMAVYKQLGQAPGMGRFTEDMDPEFTTPGDFAALGAMLQDPWTHEYGLVPIGYNSEDKTIRYIDLEFTDPNAPMLAAGQEAVALYNKLRNSEDYRDVSFLSGIGGIASTMFGPMLSVEPGTETLAKSFVDIATGQQTTDYESTEAWFSRFGKDLSRGVVPAWIRNQMQDLARGEFTSAAVRQAGVRMFEVSVPERLNNLANGIRTATTKHRNEFFSKVAKLASPAADGRDGVDFEKVKEAYVTWRQNDGRGYIRARRAGELALEIFPDATQDDIVTWLSWRDSTDRKVGFSPSDARMLMRGATSGEEEGAPLPFRSVDSDAFDPIRDDFMAGTGSGTAKKLADNQIDQGLSNINAVRDYLIELDYELRYSGTIEGIPLFEYEY